MRFNIIVGKIFEAQRARRQPSLFLLLSSPDAFINELVRHFPPSLNANPLPSNLLIMTTGFDS